MGLYGKKSANEFIYCFSLAEIVKIPSTIVDLGYRFEIINFFYCTAVPKNVWCGVQAEQQHYSILGIHLNFTGIYGKANYTVLAFVPHLSPPKLPGLL